MCVWQIHVIFHISLQEKLINWFLWVDFHCSLVKLRFIAAQKSIYRLWSRICPTLAVTSIGDKSCEKKNSLLPNSSDPIKKHNLPFVFLICCICCPVRWRFFIYLCSFWFNNFTNFKLFHHFPGIWAMANIFERFWCGSSTLFQKHFFAARMLEKYNEIEWC